MLHSFGGGTDGWGPAASLIDVNGTLYGTTAYGGAYRNSTNGLGFGTVFTITTSGTEKVLHSFGKGTDGQCRGGLINVDGTLYGTTSDGGAYGGGTVFSISTSGAEKVLHSFGKGAEQVASCEFDRRERHALWDDAIWRRIRRPKQIQWWNRLQHKHERHREGAAQLRQRQRWVRALRFLAQRERYAVRHDVYGRHTRRRNGLRVDALASTESRFHCVSRALRPLALSVLDKEFGGQGKPAIAMPRQGQGIFCRLVLSAYEKRRAVTGERALPVVEAAHIVEFSEHQRRAISNGVALRADIHKLFDSGYVSIRPEHKFVVSSALRDEYQNGVVYYELEAQLARKALSVITLKSSSTKRTEGVSAPRQTVHV